MKTQSLKFCFYTTLLALTSTPLVAGNYEKDDDDEIPFDVARIFFELNNTDGDLGIHAEIDGDEWKRLSIEDTNERRILNIRVNGRLKRQGLTEIFFESAEPTFDELDPSQFFNRFPEGIYEVEGLTLDGEEMESKVMVSHVMPAPPANITIGGQAISADCDGELPLVSAPYTLAWDLVTSSHPGLGKTGDVEIEYYEVVAENEDSELSAVVFVDGETSEWTLS